MSVNENVEVSELKVIENVEAAVAEMKVSGKPDEIKVPEEVKDKGDARIRGFVFTLNNYSEDEVNVIKNFFMEKCNWGIFGYEVGENGTPHLQGALQRKNPITIKGLKKNLGSRCHIEVMHGTYEQSKVYCSKGGNIFEHGTCPKQGNRSDIETVKDIVKSGGGMKTVIQQVNSYQAMRCGEMILKYFEKGREKKPIVYWFWGKTGMGKTKTAWDWMRKFYEPEDIYLSNKNLQWWEGYDADKVAIIDDFRKDFCTFHELLRILDWMPYRVMCKNGSRQCLAEHIIFTCPKTPLELYGKVKDEFGVENDREDIGQLLRRIDYTIEFPVVKWPWE